MSVPREFLQTLLKFLRFQTHLWALLQTLRLQLPRLHRLLHQDLLRRCFLPRLLRRTCPRHRRRQRHLHHLHRRCRLRRFHLIRLHQSRRQRHRYHRLLYRLRLLRCHGQRCRLLHQYRLLQRGSYHRQQASYLRPVHLLFLLQRYFPNSKEIQRWFREWAQELSPGSVPARSLRKQLHRLHSEILY